MRFLLATALAAVAPGAALAGESAAPPLPAAPTAAVAALAARLSSGATGGGEPLVSREALSLFYGGRGNRPAWSTASGLSPRVEPLLAALRASDREGLRPEDYHLAAIEALLARLRARGNGRPDPANGDAADLDLLLTDAFLLYGDHLTSGRVRPSAVEAEWNIEGRARNLSFLLASALEHDHLAITLQDLAPKRDDYRRLRDALAAHRATAAAGDWPTVPPGGKLRPGDSGPRIPALRRRLAATGDLPPGGDTAAGERFDEALASAVRRFQQRHGLDPDAVVGRRTLAALNTPAARRAAQIVANLERLRWMPRELGPRRLTVNVADFRLELVDRDRPPLTMRVIAGKQARRTPFFAGEITSILLNPTWTVPEKIALEDKLPLILEDPFYLEDHGFKVLAWSKGAWREIDPAAVDWKGVSKGNFPYLLRQEAGPRNALGRIKFQVPNRHDIYLHDTPSRELFARQERTFSSGCIRVEHPLDLAERLLAPNAGWPRRRIEETIASAKTVSVPLADPIPVYILSWTAWVDQDGLAQFRDDVYGRDEATLAELAKPLAVR